MAQNDDSFKSESKTQYANPSSASHVDFQALNFDSQNYRRPCQNTSTVSAAAEMALRLRATAESFNQRNFITSSTSSPSAMIPTSTSSLQAALAYIASSTLSTFAGPATEHTELYSAPDESQPMELLLRVNDGYESVDGGHKNPIFPTVTLPSVGLPSFASRSNSNFSADMPLSACFTNSLLSANMITRMEQTISANTYQQSSSPAYLPTISNALTTGFQLSGTDSVGPFNATTSTTSPTNTDAGQFSSASLTSSTTHNEDGGRKREQRLLKNREAARECRRKKKEYLRCLEHRVAVLEGQNEQLINQLKKLKSICGNAGLLIVANNIAPLQPMEENFDRRRVEGMDYVDHCSSGMKTEQEDSQANKGSILMHLHVTSDFSTSPRQTNSPTEERKLTSLDRTQSFTAANLRVDLSCQRNQLANLKSTSECQVAEVVAPQSSFFPSLSDDNICTLKTVGSQNNNVNDQHPQEMCSNLCELTSESIANNKELPPFDLPSSSKACSPEDQVEKPNRWYDQNPSSTYSPVISSPYYPPLKRELRKLDQERNRLLKPQAIDLEVPGNKKKQDLVNCDQ